MYRVSDGSGNGGYDPTTLKPNRPPPPVVRTIKPDNKQIVNNSIKSATKQPVMETVMLRNGKSVSVGKEPTPDMRYKPSAPVMFNIPKPPPEEEKKTRRRGINDIGKIVVK